MQKLLPLNQKSKKKKKKKHKEERRMPTVSA